MARIVSIHSFRGGTGKSNVTASLAALLARGGHRVGVVDTDIQSPGIHVLFGLDDEKMGKALNDFLWGKCAIEETAYDVSSVLRRGDAGGRASGRIYLIPSSIKPGEIARVLRKGYDVSLLNEGFRALVRGLELDYLLIDTHPGLNEETLLSVAISDALIVLLRPDQQDYQGTIVTVDVASRLEVPKMLLLVNKVIPAFDSEDLRRQMGQSFGIPVAAVLPLAEEMIGLGSSDVFSLRFPDHPITGLLQAVADELAR